MSKDDVIKAWKNAEYRRSLSASQRAAMPENPAGARTLSEDELEQAAGGFLSLFWCDPKPAPNPQPAPAPEPEPDDSTVWACTLSCCCSPCNTAPR